ncbi:MAG TPA: MFS transporter [Ignavibacteria bacterium]|nr:MFS transporter [Ignavibacteria bacterium]
MPLRKFILLGTLYISQFLPLGFFTEAFPVFLKDQGFSNAAVGAMHLVLLPWMFKFLWAPFVDRFGNTRFGHYKVWIIIMQFLVAGCLLIVSTLNIIIGFQIIIFLVVCLSIFAATQDIATDALAVGMLTKKEQGVGNGIQNASHFLGSMLGGGVMLIVIQTMGWSNSLMALSLLILLPLLPVLFFREERVIPKAKPSLRSNIDFFRRPGNLAWLSVLILAPLGASMADFLFKPFLVDKGFSFEEIGFVRGIIGLSAAFVGAIVGGFLMRSLGRKKIIINLALLVAFSLLVYLIPVFISASMTTIIIASIVTKFCVGMFTTSLFTLIMEKSQPGTAGTDFTVQIAILTFSAHGLASPLGGFLSDVFGYGVMFIASILLGFTSVWILSRGINDRKELNDLQPAEVN